MDTERIIGQLEQFKNWAEQEFLIIRSDISNLNKFKWTMYGGSAVISSVVCLIIQVVLKK